MPLAIISSVFFLAVAFLLHTDPLKEIPIAKPVSYYFFAEGVWTFLSGLLVLIWKDLANWMLYAHYVLLAVAAGYVFYCCCALYQARKEGTDDAQIPGISSLLKRRTKKAPADSAEDAQK